MLATNLNYIENKEKYCKKCNQYKPVSEFYLSVIKREKITNHKSESKSGYIYYGYCKECGINYNKQYRLNNGLKKFIHKHCVLCGNELPKGRGKFCSDKCGHKFHSGADARIKRYPMNKCIYCNNEFKPTTFKSRYCSRQCSLEHLKVLRRKNGWTPGLTKCKICGNEFHQKSPGKIYCSVRCRMDARNNAFNTRRKNEAAFRLKKNFGRQIYEAIKKNKKGLGWEKHVGYDTEQLRTHLEKQFKEGMTWENYGRNGWVVDHKIPKVIFNYNSSKDKGFQECWSLENLQPLWETDNIKKADKLFH